MARSKRRISVSQQKYMIDPLTETGILRCKPNDTVIEAGKKNEDIRTVRE